MQQFAFCGTITSVGSGLWSVGPGCGSPPATVRGGNNPPSPAVPPIPYTTTAGPPLAFSGPCAPGRKKVSLHPVAWREAGLALDGNHPLPLRGRAKIWKHPESTADRFYRGRAGGLQGGIEFFRRRHRMNNRRKSASRQIRNSQAGRCTIKISDSLGGVRLWCRMIRSRYHTWR